MHNEKDETFGTNGMDDKRLERFLEKNLKEEDYWKDLIVDVEYYKTECKINILKVVDRILDAHEKG